jgi:hypothetical protein
MAAGANIVKREGRNLAEWLSAIEGMHPDSVALGLSRADRVRRRMGLDLSAAMPVIIVGDALLKKPR